MEIKEDTIRKLIMIGGDPQHRSSETLAVLESLKRCDYLNRLHWSSWKPLATEMPREDLFQLIRGLTIAEEHHHWIGGSTAAVIWVFQVFQSRFEDEAGGLADWILRNSSNSYVPFGSNYDGVRTLEEYLRDQEHKRFQKTKQAAKRQLDEKEQQCKRDERIRERARTAREHFEEKARRDEERRALLEKIKRMPRNARIELIAYGDLSLPIDVIPPEIIEEGDLELIEIGKEARTALLEKIGRRRGGWEKLRRKLIEATDSGTDVDK